MSFSTSLTGLKAAQLQIDTSAHNIANASTPNFRRQEILLAENIPFQKDGLIMGTGVQVSSIQKASNPFLENQLKASNQFLGDYTESAKQAQAISNTLETAASTFSNTLNAFKTALSKASTSPSDSSLRTNVLEQAKALATAANSLTQDLDNLGASQTKNQSMMVDKANSLLNTIKEYNHQINTLGSSHVSEDNIKGAVLEFSQITGSSYQFDAQNRVSLIGNKGVGYLQGEAILPVSANNAGGAIQAMGAAIVESTSLSQSLGTLTQGLFDKLNQIHESGFGLTGTTGKSLFSKSSGTWQVPVSSAELAFSSTANSPLNNDNLTKMLGEEPITKNLADLVAEKGLKANMTQQSANMAESQFKGIQKDLDVAVGVNLDEEIVNQMKAKTMYEACAKCITTQDQIFQTLLSIKA